MMQGSELPFLIQRQNVYMIMGTAAATLTGLKFVVTTLIAGIDAHLSTLNAAVSAYNTQPLCNLPLSFCWAGPFVLKTTPICGQQISATNLMLRDRQIVLDLRNFHANVRAYMRGRPVVPSQHGQRLSPLEVWPPALHIRPK